MKRILFLSSMFFAAALQAASLQVIQQMPLGEMDSLDSAREVVATFSQPMVALQGNAEMGDFCPMRITPSMPGRCRWRSTNTLVFELEGTPKPGTEYSVLIPRGIASQVSGDKLAQEVRWTFVTPRPRLLSSAPSHDERWVDLEPKLFLEFSQAMDPAKASEHLVLEEAPAGQTDPDPQPGQDLQPGSRRVPLQIASVGKEELDLLRKSGALGRRYLSYRGADQLFKLSPQAKLKPGKRYRIWVLRGMPGAGGTVGTVRTQLIAFETWGDFALRSVNGALDCGYPAGARFKGAMLASPTWEFSNPVDAKSFFANLKITPLPPAPAGKADDASREDGGDENGYYDEEGEYQGGGSSFSGPVVNGQALKLYDRTATRDGQGRQHAAYRVVTLRGLHLALGQTYTFELGAGAKDAYGNALGKPVTVTQTVPDYCPQLLVNGGFSVLESYLKPWHPADGLNVKAWPLSLWGFGLADYVPALESLRDYQSTFPGKPAIETEWSMDAPANTRSRSYFDLSLGLRGRKGGLAGFEMPQLGESGYKIRGVDNLTDLGLTFKTAPDSTLLWVTRLKDASPAANAAVQLRLPDNKVVWSGRSDAQGLARAPGWRALGVSSWDSSDEVPRLYAVAFSVNGDAVLGSQSSGIEPWRFGLDYAWKPEERHHRGTVFTDRGVYRPGETVKMKAVFRSLEVSDWAWPRSKEIKVTLSNSRGETVLSKDLALGERGSLSLSWDVPADAPTGQYSLQLQQARRNVGLYSSFRVEAFKPAAFEVRVKNQRPEAYRGEEVGASVEGWYLYGAPMSEAEAEYSILFQPSDYSPPGWEEYSFGRGWWEDAYRGQRLAGSGKLSLTAKGLGELSISTQDPQIPGPFLVRYEVGVTSPDRQRLFGRSSHLVHPSRYYVGARLGARVLEAGQTQPLQVIVTDVQGRPVPGVEVQGRWHRRERMSVRRVGLHGRLTWEHSSKDVPLKDFKLKSASKPVDWGFAPDKAGEYYLALEVKDPAGLANHSASMVYVAGPGQSWWAQQDHDLIQLVADKKEYAPGDTARILVQSPWQDAQALVTVERETVMESFTVQLKSASSLIEVPIKEAYLPNAFVSVTLLRGRLAEQDYDEEGLDLSKPQARFGYVNLPVLPAGRRLSVGVQLDKQDYRPGDTVKATLHAADAAGGAETTELTVWAVDEGVLQLTGYQTPDLFNAFYGPRPLYVRTADARLHVLGQRSYGEKGQDRGGGGGAPDMEAIDLRGDFRFLAHWSATLVTDAKGDAKLEFKLPDNLTAFRLMVAAHTKLRFGKGERRFTVSKPLMLRPSLPRFARLGDAFEGGVVVHNNSGKDAVVQLQAKLGPGGFVALSGPASRSLKVPAGKAVEARWPLAALKLGKAALEFRAAATLDAPESDGLAWSLPVTVPEKRETVATAGVAEEPVAEALRLPKEGVAETGDLTATFASTALGGLKDGVDYLLQYPYGCLEQRLSRSLPIVAGAEVLEAFQLKDLADQKKAVQEVLDKLPSYQCGGGYTYWGQCGHESPSPYLTAYALEVAWLAQKAGFNVPAASLADAQRWLKGVFDEKQRWGYPYSFSELFVMRAYALDVLSLYGSTPNGYLDQLYGRRDQLPFLAKAHVLKAAAMLKADEKTVATLAQELLNQAKLAPRSLHFELPEGESMPWVHSSAVQATAVCLEALLASRGGFSGDEKAVAWLSGERKDKGRWRSTQENAWGLRAFGAFFKRYESQPPSFTASLGLEGPGTPRLLWQEAFEGRSLATLSKQLPFAEVFGSGEEARLSLKRQGQGRLYYSLAMQYVPKRFDKPAWEGFELERQVFDLESGQELASAYKAGKRYKVKLTVRSHQARTFVALVDPLPGGLEAVNTAFANEGQQQVTTAGGLRGSTWGGFMHSELYDDRVQIFANYLEPGTHTWSYLVQATSPGSFAKPAAWVEQMYEPEVFGRTASAMVEVAPAP